MAKLCSLRPVSESLHFISTNFLFLKFFQSIEWPFLRNINHLNWMLFFFFFFWEEVDGHGLCLRLKGLVITGQVTVVLSSHGEINFLMVISSPYWTGGQLIVDPLKFALYHCRWPKFMLHSYQWRVEPLPLEIPCGKDTELGLDIHTRLIKW